MLVSASIDSCQNSRFDNSVIGIVATLQGRPSLLGCELAAVILVADRTLPGVAGLSAAPGEPVKVKKTILCVDDNEQSLSIRKVMLETRGYRVVACNNGQDALAAFRQGGIDLVLSDLIMPGLDGTELIERIKNEAPCLPAILFSGKIKVYEKDTRADLFLPKGMYAPAELLERIRVLLVRKRGPKRSAHPEDSGVVAAS